MSLIVQITKGLFRDQYTRRALMFGVVLFTLVMLFSGATILSRYLSERPLVFMAYWLACAWLTLLTLLLAIYDLLAVRAKAARERRKLRAQVFGDQSGKGES